MRRAISVLRAADLCDRAPIASVTLAHADRHRRRVRLDDDRGTPFLLDLARATALADGDRLVLDDGEVIEVRAAPEPVADIACRDAMELARIAWHIGNRHVPLEVLSEDRLRIQFDHVLVDMIRGLGYAPTIHDAPFAPEPGAYGGPGHNHHHA